MYTKAQQGFLFAALLGLLTAAALAGTKGDAPNYAASKVGRWERFETTVTNGRGYPDPYNDVTLDVTYTRPDGTTINFWGFYDGGQTWRVRFMPDQLGTWRYRAAFSDSAPGVSGTFECVPSSVPGMLSRDEANPRWFGFKGGGHVLIRSFHAGPLFDYTWDDPDRPDDGERREAFLDWAAAERYNTFSSRSHFSVRSSSPGGPKLWPLNAAEYRKVERVLEELARRRMMVHGFGGFFGNETPYPTTPQDQERYVRYAIARFGPFWNQMWNVAGPEPNLTKHLSGDDVNRLGALIHRLDPFGHPLGVHNKDGDDPYRDSAWSSFVTLQDEITDLAKVGEYLRRNHTGRKPVYAHETIWMGNTLQPPWTLDDLRRHVWVHMMSAAAYNAGDMNGRSGSGFSGSLDLKEMKRERHDVPKMIWDFMESVPFYRMTPDQSITSAGFCLAEPGERYLVYLPAGGAVGVGVRPGKTYAVTWVNAREPRERRPTGTTADGRNLVAPDNQDWVLHLQSSGEPSREAKQ